MLMNKPTNLIDSGLYIIYKKNGPNICFENKIDKTTELIDFCSAKALLFNSFPEEKVEKTINLLTEGKHLFVDFNKEKIFLLEDKPVDYLKSFWSTSGTTDAVTEELNKSSLEALAEAGDINAIILEKFQSEEIQ